MIGFLKGHVIEASVDAVMLNVGGVGYELTCSINTILELQEKINKETFLQVYTHVREDALQLFGFLSKSEKEMFTSLLKVNGVGPKSAINILSGADFNTLISYIETEDVQALSKLPRVGKKTAEQIVLSLKGKLVIESKSTAKPKNRELVSALVNLGFRTQDVDKVVSTLPKDIDLEKGLKEALQALTSV